MTLALQEDVFTLTAPNHLVSEFDQAHALSILDEIDAPRELFPLVCVTFKMPLTEKKRMQAVCEKWELNYSEILRRMMDAMVNVMENPSDQVLEILVANREAVLARRKEAEERRLRIKERRDMRSRRLALTAEAD